MTPITVIIEPASVDNMPRAPSAPAPNRRGHRASQRSFSTESTSINAAAMAMLPATISVGKTKSPTADCSRLFERIHGSAGGCGGKFAHEAHGSIVFICIVEVVTYAK